MSKISVIMPVYNAEHYVTQAIESILTQTYQDFELIVINDASEDSSMEKICMINDKRIRILENKYNMGISATRNLGLDIADGEYIALLDNDDIAVRRRFEWETAYLDENPDIMVVGGHQREIDEYGKLLYSKWITYLNPSYIKAFLLFNNAIVNGSTMFRKEFIEKNHIRYQKNMCGAEDYMFWVECSLHGKIKNLDEVMLFWRKTAVHQTTSILQNRLDERNAALDLIRHKALEGNGFTLLPEDYDIINRSFAEESTFENIEEINILYRTLKKIVHQAVENNVANREEIRTMCRKRLGEKIGKAFFLW